MQKVIICVLAMFSLVIGQISMSDINRLNEKQIDAIKSELSSNPQLIPASVKKNQTNVVNEADLNPVNIPMSESQEESYYFGYDYFKREINFFDNTPTPSDYKLGPGDEIILSLWGETNRSDAFTINKEGLIYYENIGFVNLSNKTIKEAEEILNSRLIKIYSTLQSKDNPTRLMLELGKIKAINVYFSGQLEQPGIHLVHPFADIFSAIAQAGGVKTSASLRKIQLIRDNKVISQIDFYSFFINGINDFSDEKLIDGDTIHIPVVSNRVEILGNILSPGIYETLRDETVNDLVLFAGKLKKGTRSTFNIDRIITLAERTSDDFAKVLLEYNINELNSVKVKDGDTVYFNSINEVDTTVEVFGRVKQEGDYPASNSLYQVLQLAGGFGDPVYRRSINENEILVLRKDETEFYSKKFIVSYDDSREFKLVVGDKIFVYEMTNYNNSFIIEVGGQVNMRGIYPYESGITVGEAINNAGSFTELANPQSIILVSELQKINESGEISVEMIRVSDVDLNTKVATNSQIEILPMSFTVNVEGNVFDPGLIKFDKRNNLKDYIRAAGGTKKFTEFRNIYVKHANGNVSKPRMWRLFNGFGIKIKSGDQIIVPKDENAEDFDLTSFSADLATIIANVVGVLLMAQSISDN